MLVWIILPFIAILLQSTLFSKLKLWGVKPDLITLVVLYAAFWKGASRGATAGFIGGMIEDIFSAGSHLGANALAKVVGGFVFGLSRKRFFTQDTRFQIIAAFLGTVLTQFLFFLLMKLCGKIENTASSIRMVFPIAGYNAILAPFVFLSLRKVLKKRYDRAKPD